ncbi:MAG: vWA domain-containing protein [Pirellulales bacterium]
MISNLLQRLNSNFELGARNTLSFMVSLTVHILMLLGLALWVVVAGSASTGIMVTASTGDSADTILDLAPSANAEESSLELSSTFESLFKQSEFEFKAEGLVSNQGSTDANLVAGALTSTGLRTISDGLDSRGLGRGASFFGSYAQGGRFVYVIDSSKSMKGERWAVARQKLLESLRSLEKEQEFFVICFDEQTSLLFNCKPQEMEFKKVNDVIIERVSRWLRSRTLGPATMPAESLQLAISMRPDAIFILSDGELQDDSIQMLRLTNVDVGSKHKIPIHAIHLISEQGMSTLQQLADDNGGSFRHVSR